MDKLLVPLGGVICRESRHLRIPFARCDLGETTFNRGRLTPPIYQF